jgi:type IV pilus assembly protein PilF
MTRGTLTFFGLVCALTFAGCAGVPDNAANGGANGDGINAPPRGDSRADTPRRFLNISDGAGEVSRPMADQTPSTPSESRARLHVELGVAYLSTGRADTALDEVKIALKENGSYAPAHHLAGLAYMMLGENAKADESFRYALSGAPGDPDFNNSYGWFLCQHGRAQEAFPHFARAARNPYYRYQTRPYTNAGLCHVRLKNDVAAEAQFARALEVDPSNGDALYQIAAINYRRGEYRTAYEQLARLHQQREPSAATTWLGLRTSRKLGEYNAQASYAEQLRQRFSNSVEYSLLLRGKFDE